MSRDYYNRRIGTDAGPPRLTLEDVQGQFAAAYDFVDQKGFLQLAFGYHCVDAGDVAGLEGSDVRAAFYLATGIRVTERFGDWLKSADEPGLFTAAEFLWDHVARPLKGTGWYHDYSGCGWHFSGTPEKFEKQAAKEEWRAKLNAFLKFYGEGFFLSEVGEIVRIVPDGMATLTEAPLAKGTSDKDRAKVANAVRTFRLGRATREQRQQATRDLADILEFHRSAVLEHLAKKDESDLFNIANNFALRHHNALQRDDYGDDWLAWIFYTYLATVHLVLGRVHGAAVPAFQQTAPEPASGTPPAKDADDDLPF